jgi:hypothetical protein
MKKTRYIVSFMEPESIRYSGQSFSIHGSIPMSVPGSMSYRYDKD